MYTPIFAELVGDEKEFFSTYFNKMPLLRPRALAGDPRQVLSIADLDQFLHFEAIRPPYLRIAKDGDGVTEAAYIATTRVQGANVTDTVVPEKVYELFRTGATITWNSVNHFHPGLRALTRALASKFATRSDVVAFLTPPHKEGFPPHHDPVDLFIVQLEGSKYWKLWRPPAVRRGDIRHYKPEELGDPVIETVLQPGDVLYLPYNTPHVAAAQDQVSLHLSVMVRPRLWSDLLRELADRLLDDPEFWQFPYLSTDTVNAQAPDFGEYVALLAKRLQGMNLEDELRHLITAGQNSPGSSEGDAFQAMAAIDAIGPATLLRRTTVDVTLLETTDGKTKARVKGHTIMLPTAIASALESVRPADDIAVRDVFPGADRDRAVGAAQSLTRLGIFTVAETTP